MWGTAAGRAAEASIAGAARAADQFKRTTMELSTGPWSSVLDELVLRLGHGPKRAARRGQRGSGHRHRAQAQRHYRQRGAVKV